MKKTIFSLLAILTLSSLMFFTSCNKDQNVDTETVEAIIEGDNATVEGVVLAQENSGEEKLASGNGCMTITHEIDLENQKITIIIEFNGICDDGIERSGRMIIVADLGWRINPLGKEISITYENFTRRHRIFNGSISYSVDVDTVDSVVVMNTTLDNFSIAFPDSTSISLSGNKSIAFVQGFRTFWNRNDDILKINANLEGTNRKGEHFLSITEDVIIKRACNYFFPVSGTKTIEFDDGRTYLVDFGDGTCDKIYTVTVNGETYTMEYGNNDLDD